MDSVEQLADRIDEKGLGTKTLYSIEQGNRPLFPSEATVIASSCNVPVAFLTAEDPFERSEDPTRAEVLAAVQDNSRKLDLLLRYFGISSQAEDPRGELPPFPDDEDAEPGTQAG